MIGKTAIRSLLILIFATSCAAVPLAYRPTIPERPQLTEDIQSVEHNGHQYVVVEMTDWRAIGTWVLSVERELKAACLALGQTKVACHAE